MLRLTLFLLLLPCFAAYAKPDSQFIGAQSCTFCHAEETRLWQTSHHARSMQKATTDSVLGDFSDITVNFHNSVSRMYRKSDTYFINTLGADGKLHNYEIKYTFGFTPLQQYLVETEKGHFQALNIAWDSRSETEGGQRWMHLRAEEKMNPENIFFWTRHFQNWNSRCAECHSTNVNKNYEDQENSYQTTWSEINVACEACHGPASQHVFLAQSDQLTDLLTGFTQKLSPPLHWQFSPGKHIAETAGTRSEQAMNTCGRCHSLRSPIADYRKEKSYHDAFRLQLLNNNLYFPDGQIREEVFVMGSFLQSKMYRAGVTCTNCHNPHSGALKIEGNGLCTQCHESVFYDNSNHHHHKAESAGAACVNCHMPSRTYMQVDARRDHSFMVPRPDLSLSLGVPNACDGCHIKESDRATSWAQNILHSWGEDNVTTTLHWGELNRQTSPDYKPATPSLTEAINNEQYAAIVRASLLDASGHNPDQNTIRTSIKQLKNDDALIRRAAVQALTNLPIQHRWLILSPYIGDIARSVRITIAQALLGYYQYGSARDKQALLPLINEYRGSLKFTEDSPATQLLLADLESQLGDRPAAIRSYEQALTIAPAYVPALINYAEFLRNTGNVSNAGRLFKQAVNLAPDSGISQYNLGLHFVRKKQYGKALPHLKLAGEQADAIPQFNYVYAVALQNQGELQKAISVLVGSTDRWPNNYKLLILLVYYLDESGKSEELLMYLDRLSKIAPTATEVLALKEKFQQVMSPD